MIEHRLDLESRIIKAFQDDEHFPNPSEVTCSAELIRVRWEGNHEGLADAAGMFLQRHNFNYVDPRPGGADNIIIDATEAYFSVTWPRFNRVRYDDALQDLPLNPPSEEE